MAFFMVPIIMAAREALLLPAFRGLLFRIYDIIQYIAEHRNACSIAKICAT